METRSLSEIVEDAKKTGYAEDALTMMPADAPVREVWRPSRGKSDRIVAGQMCTTKIGRGLVVADGKKLQHGDDDTWRLEWQVRPAAPGAETERCERACLRTWADRVRGMPGVCVADDARNDEEHARKMADIDRLVTEIAVVSALADAQP